MKVNYVIPDFVRRIDQKAQKVGTFGDPPYSVIMHNALDKVTYYLHYIAEFWRSFGKYYPQIGGYGLSVAKEELVTAVGNGENCYTVVAMPHKQKGVVFYGIKTKEWHDFCEHNKTWNNHTSGSLTNGSIAARFVKNMEN